MMVDEGQYGYRVYLSDFYDDLTIVDSSNKDQAIKQVEDFLIEVDKALHKLKAMPEKEKKIKIDPQKVMNDLIKSYQFYIKEGNEGMAKMIREEIVFWEDKYAK